MDSYCFVPIYGIPWYRGVPAPAPARIISLSIKKLSEMAKSSPYQPRLSNSPLCAPWQPQAVKRGKICPLIAPSYQ